MLFFCITLATRKLAPTPTVAERLRGGSILFLFTVAMLLARHPSGIPGEWIAVRTFAITGIIYLGKLFRIFRARLPLDGRIATLCLVILLAAAAASTSAGDFSQTRCSSSCWYAQDATCSSPPQAASRHTATG